MFNKLFNNVAAGVAISVIAASAVFLPKFAMASDDRYPYNRMSQDTCLVNGPYWAMNAGNRDRLLLPRAMYHANFGPGQSDSACLKEITLMANQIGMRGHMIIRARGNTGSPFVLRGGCTAQDPSDDTKCSTYNGVTTLDATLVPVPTEAGTCLINILGPSVKFQGIKVINVPRDMKAICINGNDAIMDGVEIENVGGDGFVFGDVSNGRVTAYSSVRNAAGYAIDFGDVGENTLSLNRVELYNFSGLPISGTTDESGLLMPPGGSKLFEITGNDVDRYFHSNSPAQVCMKSKTRDSDSGKIRFVGWVKETAGDDLLEAPPSDEVGRLAIFKSGGFYGYVGPWNQAVSAGMGQNGATSTGEYVGLTGYFSFMLPQDTGSVVLVPVAIDGNIGRPSAKMDVAAGGGDTMLPCRSQELGDIPGGGTPPGGTPGLTTDRRRIVPSVAECRRLRGYPSPGSRGTEIGDIYDTDGDNTPDDREDVNRNCVCDADETCWSNPDTDNDGIPDGFGQENMNQGSNLDNDKTALDTLKYNAIDSDSDNDGVVDGREDRNQFTYTTSSGGTTRTQNLLYHFGSVFSPYPVQKADESGPVTCSLGSNEVIGVRYMWYSQASADADPQPMYGYPRDNQPGRTVDIYVCRNQSLNSSVNFNGSYDQGNSEMDFLDADTDGDGWCDGSGYVGQVLDGCMRDNGITNGNTADQCPIIGVAQTDSADNTANASNFGCPARNQLPCFPNQVYYTTDYNYVVWDREGNPLRLRDGWPTNASGTPVDPGDGTPSEPDRIPDVFQVRGGCAAIESLCGDTDQDGIPDCVENPSGLCSGACGDRTAAGGSTDPVGLKHYCADTDNDGKLDGWRGAENEDVCPVTRGEVDGVNQSGSKSCTTQDFYIARPVIACFLDRDQDTLRDAFEDKSLNGRYDAIVPGVSGIGSTESNALVRDSDGDGIEDKDEVNGWPIATNPSDQDTDDDGLDDNVEDRDSDGRITVTMMEGRGCEASRGYDTNPTLIDTDDDTLSDGLETDGGYLTDAEFLRRILEPATWRGGGLPYDSSPLAKDSDRDGLDDNQEYNGERITYLDSNPCMPDSDGDTRPDGGAQGECRGCKLNPSPSCVCAVDGSTGLDSDGDGLSNDIETRLGTDSSLPDSDGDGLWDGIEDANHNGIYEPNLGESNPLSPDTDSDGLRDGMEVRYGTDATKADHDSDCIPDGIEDANHNGIYDPTETNAIEADTDGDGLPDGLVRGIGEDMNCNGVRDVDSGGGFLETDPTNPDSDYDGNSDRDEMFSGGSFNVSNVGRANSGREGCSMMGAAGSAPTSMYYLLGLVLFATRVVRRKVQGR